MGMKDVILTIVLVLFIISHVANADFLLNFRKLANEDPKATPIPSLVGGVGNGKVKNDHISPTSTPEENKSKEDQVKNISPAAKPPTDTKKPYSPVKDVKEHDIDTSNDKGKADNRSPKEELTEKEKGKTKGAENCDGVERRCQDDNSMIACIKSFDDVSKVVVLLIQNKGENSLKVDLTSSSGIEQEATEIPKLQTEQEPKNGILYA